MASLSSLFEWKSQEWEDEHDTDPDAVKVLTEMWKMEARRRSTATATLAKVKGWMDNSLGAVYSERTLTKKIQAPFSFKQRVRCLRRNTSPH